MLPYRIQFVWLVVHHTTMVYSYFSPLFRYYWKRDACQVTEVNNSRMGIHKVELGHWNKFPRTVPRCLSLQQAHLWFKAFKWNLAGECRKPPLLFEVGRALKICKKNLFNFCGPTIFGLGGLACLFWRVFGTWEETSCQLLEHVLLWDRSW